jgi:hypothetical protein
MSMRRSVLGLVACAAFGLSACAGATASALPSVGVPSLPASIGTGDLEGFCEDFAGALAADWPNLDQSTANELSSVVTEWATTPGLVSITGDIQTIGTWLTTTIQSGTASTPPPDVETAFQNVSDFADANC